MESHEITAKIDNVELTGVIEIENDDVTFRFESAATKRCYAMVVGRATLKKGLSEELRFEHDALGRFLAFKVPVTARRLKQLGSWDATLTQRVMGDFTLHEPIIKWLEEHL
jgi:hypothetical protein